MEAPPTAPWEAALAAIADNARPTGSEDADTELALIAAKCRALIVGYAWRWANAPYRPVEVESTIEVDLVNPATGKASDTFTVAGKLDVVAVHQQSGLTILIDHKTTSESIEQPDAPFWQELRVAAQPTHYMLAKWIAGEKMDEALWDVVRKPTIGPRKLKTKAERNLALANRTYCGRPLSEASLEHLLTNDTEDLAMYEARLVLDCCEVRPAWYFQRRCLARIDADLLEYAADLWETGRLLEFYRSKEVPEDQPERRFPKHPGHCMSYGRPCGYLGLCSRFDRPDSDHWRVKPQVHSELALAGDGRSVLTYSSTRTLQSCPRRYYWQYERGIERADRGEAEALRFGTLIHLALEAYWRAMLRP